MPTTTSPADVQASTELDAAEVDQAVEPVDELAAVEADNYRRALAGGSTIHEGE